MSTVHASHPDIVKRLKRASGHLNKVITMIEEGTPCLDVAQQLHAVANAVAHGLAVGGPAWFGAGALKDHDGGLHHRRARHRSAGHSSRPCRRVLPCDHRLGAGTRGVDVGGRPQR